MGWVTNEGTHEGYVGAEVPDGRLAATYSSAGVEVWNPETNTFDKFANDDVVAWVVTCEECGWRGSRWERVTDHEQADWDANRVYVSPEEHMGWAPESVDEAGHQEWEQHLRPVLALDELGKAAREAGAARRRLDLAVVDARDSGASWADVGRATGMSRQSAHQRWGVADAGGSP